VETAIKEEETEKLIERCIKKRGRKRENGNKCGKENSGESLSIRKRENETSLLGKAEFQNYHHLQSRVLYTGHFMNTLGSGMKYIKKKHFL
jgi:hypothetical protein